MKQLSMMEMIIQGDEKSCLDCVEKLVNNWSVYLLKCSDGTLYCGISNNLILRVRIHNEGKGARYTRSRLPVTLIYHEEIGTRSQAMKRERQIKKMTRAQKNDLCDSI